MPLLNDPETVYASSTARSLLPRKQSQHSDIARSAIMNVATPPADLLHAAVGHEMVKSSLAPPPRMANGRASDGDGVGVALTDTPATTAPNSPKM